MDFSNYVCAGYPLLWVSSYEEYRVLISCVADMAKAKEKYEYYAWDVIDGIRLLSLENGLLSHSQESIKMTITNANGDKEQIDTNMDPLIPLRWLDEMAKDNTILFLKDYNPFLDKSFKDSVLLSRKIRNLLNKFSATAKALVILSPTVSIPSELEKEITVINFKLPTREDLKIVLKGACESTTAQMPKEIDAIIDSALGMTVSEAQNAFCISMIESKKFDPTVIRR